MPKTATAATPGAAACFPGALPLLGLCPALAVSSSALRGLALGLLTVLVMLGASVLVRAWHPWRARQGQLPLCVLTVMGCTCAAEALLVLWRPQLAEALGMFPALIAVNCLVLWQVAQCAAGRPRAYRDTLRAGGLFLAALGSLGALRELLGYGALGSDLALLAGGAVLPPLVDIPGWNGFAPARQPAGAFFCAALLLAVVQRYRGRQTPSAAAPLPGWPP